MTMPTGKGRAERHDKLHPPFAQPDPGRRATAHMATQRSDQPLLPADRFESPQPPHTELDSPTDVPSIDQFVDELPLIDEFLMESRHPTGTAADTEGWADADWQSYDWSRLASLGTPAPEAAEAHAAWSTTNWDAGRAAKSDEPAYASEDEVAAALDEIARKIRSGELSLHQFRGSPPEAAISAAFASLLRSKE